jgi:hypothetical protein
MIIGLMAIEEIHELWSEDVKIDDLELDFESLKIPQLHSKYMKILTNENRQLYKMQYTHAALARDKLEYYQGKMCEEDLEERGWEPLTLKVLRADAPKYVEGDNDIIKHLIQIADQREKVVLLNSIIASVNSRSYIITNAINWKKFTNPS